MKAQCLCWFFFLVAKELILKLGRFSYAFAENTNEMSLGNDFRWREDRFQTTIYTLSKENQGEIPTFFKVFFACFRPKGRMRPRFAGVAGAPR